MIRGVVFTSRTISRQAHLKVISNWIINQQPFPPSNGFQALESNDVILWTFYTLRFADFADSYKVMFVLVFHQKNLYDSQLVPIRGNIQFVLWHVKKLIMISSARITKDHLPRKHNVYWSTRQSIPPIHVANSTRVLIQDVVSIEYHGLYSTPKDSMIVHIPPIHVATPTRVLKLISDQRWIRCRTGAKSCGDHAIVSIRSTATKTTTVRRIHHPPKRALRIRV